MLFFDCSDQIRAPLYRDGKHLLELPGKAYLEFQRFEFTHTLKAIQLKLVYGQILPPSLQPMLHISFSFLPCEERYNRTVWVPCWNQF